MATEVGTKFVVIEGVEKRIIPTKHYVYVLQVEMSDRSTYRVYRRYNDFLKLQTILCKLFPMESGNGNRAERILPFIPGKAASGKNHVSCTAIERISQLEEFCKRLIQMPAHISQCQLVKDFYSRRQEDEDGSHKGAVTNRNFIPKSNMTPSPTTPPSASSASLLYRARDTFVPDEIYSKSQIPLSKGEMVEVIEKLDIGWWYVEAGCGQGWVPASCLESPPGNYEDDEKIYASLGIPEGKPYIVTKCYRAAASDELSIRRGTCVAVLEKKNDGWWLAEFEGVRGMVPGCFLVRRNAAKGIRLIKESTTEANPITVIETPSNDATSPKSPPVPKPRRKVASPLSTPLSSTPPSPFPSPLPSPKPRQTNGSRQPPDRNASVVEESSSDEDDANSEQLKPQPPPPREASYKLEKQIALPNKGTQAVEKKVFRVCLDYEAVVPGTVGLTKGQEIQVMPRVANNGWMEVKVDGKKGFVPKECVEEIKKPSPSKPKGNQKCDLQDIEDAYWSGDALEGERVLHSIRKEGTFMMRKSQSNENQETLLVYEDGRILKYKLKHKRGCGYTLSKTSPIFEALDELIFFYTQNLLPKVSTKLQSPYQRLMGAKSTR